MNALRLLPKVDLHVHLDGSVKPATLLALAKRLKLPLPARDEERLLPYVQVGEDCANLKDYLSKFDFVLPFLQTAEALERVAEETVAHAAEHRIKYIEVRFAPQLHRGGGLSADDAIARVIEGLRSGEAKYGVKARAIAICMRNHPAHLNLETVEAAARHYGKGLVAVDLAGDEASYPAAMFRDVFALAKARGIPVTIHAGEAAGPDNIEEAVERLGASRIGHGVRLKEDDRVFGLVRDRRIPLELCRRSNIQTKAVSGWDRYPIREYFDRGILFTVNTDNPGVSGTDITREYEVLRDRFGFTLGEMSELVLNGVRASFLEESEKAALMRDIQDEMSLLVP